MATSRTETPAAPKRRQGVKGKGPQLKDELRDFAKGRPEGWNHQEWLGFLEHLKSQGHNIHDHEAIGTMLERERINVLLEKVPGLGPQRIGALAERFGTVWRLRAAGVEELAAAAKLPRPLAERVADAMR